MSSNFFEDNDIYTTNKEVFDFIQFLETRKEKKLLAKASQEISRVSFEKVWDNEEDAVYDSL